MSDEATDRSVLIVDDNELDLRLAETVLLKAGFEVGLARSAAEARERPGTA
jgi:CheY-like chemotaxis protein